MQKRKNGSYSLATDTGIGLTPPRFYRMSIDGMFKRAQAIANARNEIVYLTWENGKFRELVEFFKPKY